MKVKDFIAIMQNYVDSNFEISVNGERNIRISYNKNSIDISGEEQDYIDGPDEGDGENL